MASRGPCFCLDAISFGFNIFIHSLLFSFIGQLILFIICPYLQAWQSNLHSGSADRWKNDPFLTLPPRTPLLPSFLSSLNSNETWLTARCISSCHSNLTILLTSAFFLYSTLSPSVTISLSLLPSPLHCCCNDWERDRQRREISKPESTLGSWYAFLPCITPISIPPPRSLLSPFPFLISPHPWQWFTNSYGAPLSSILAYQGL